MKLKASNQAKINKISSKKLSRLSCFKMTYSREVQKSYCRHAGFGLDMLTEQVGLLTKDL